MNRTYSENELVELLKVHDATAFAYLYNLYKDAVYSIILQFLPPVQAGDVLQEVFIIVWNKFGTYDPAKGRLFTWIIRVARNQCIDVLRSSGYRSGLLTEEIETTEKERFCPDSPVKIDTGLLKAVNKLNPKQKQLIILAYLQGYTRQQIGHIQGISANTVKTRLRRALLELRKQLEDAQTIHTWR